MTQKPSLTVLETPLHFSGEPAIDRRRERTIIVGDLASVHAHSTRSVAGWHPVCTLQFYGGEEVTLALDPVPARPDAQASARELAHLFQSWVDEGRFGDRSDYRDGWPCAACMSSGVRETPPTTDTLDTDTSKGSTS